MFYMWTRLMSTAKLYCLYGYDGYTLITMFLRVAHGI